MRDAACVTCCVALWIRLWSFLWLAESTQKMRESRNADIHTDQWRSFSSLTQEMARIIEK
jgi:hypothetical protein